MSHTRPEQVAELTRGHNVPLDPLPEENLMIVAEALGNAWDGLLLTQHQTLVAGGEAEVTTLMESRLKNLLDEDCAWSLLVSNVERGKETMNFDASSLEMRPDLSLYLTDRRRRPFPLIVECKLLHATLGKRVSLYCDDGLARFLRGDYAWATREAFMLAYVRDGSTIPLHLVPFLTGSRGGSPDAYQTHEPPRMMDNSEIHLAKSKHNRSFSYIGHNPQDGPGIITLWHLWLYSRP